MIISITSKGPGDDLSSYWDALRGKDHTASFGSLSSWIRETARKGKKPRGKKDRHWLKWTAALLIPLLIVSSAFKVKREEVVGTMISFGVPQQDTATLSRINRLQSAVPFGRVPSRRGPQTGLLYFFSFIPVREKEKAGQLQKEVRRLPAVSAFQNSPVQVTLREPLISALSFSLFRVHITEQKPSGAQLHKAVAQQLEQRGFGAISFTLEGDHIRLLESDPAEPAPPAPQLPVVEGPKASQNSTPPGRKVESEALPQPQDTTTLTYLITSRTTKTELIEIMRQINATGFHFRVTRTFEFDGAMQSLDGEIRGPMRKDTIRARQLDSLTIRLFPRQERFTWQLKQKPE